MNIYDRITQDRITLKLDAVIFCRDLADSPSAKTWISEIRLYKIVDRLTPAHYLFTSWPRTWAITKYLSWAVHVFITWTNGGECCSGVTRQLWIWRLLIQISLMGSVRLWDLTLKMRCDITLGEWGCLLVSGPKLVLQQPNHWLKRTKMNQLPWYVVSLWRLPFIKLACRRKCI